MMRGDHRVPIFKTIALYYETHYASFIQSEP